VGLDLSLPMLEAARARCVQAGVERRVSLAMAAVDCLPVRTSSCNFLVAHGIWNLAPSSEVFRAAVREAARVAKPGAALFVFTFSRGTLDADVAPVAGEPFVFTEFAGHPQCFLTSEQLTSELAAAGFTLDPSLELRELNRPPSGAFRTPQAPVIYEGLFRFGAEPRRADG
jgi:ubiquinone/menaquinone biosynthesis C-methylase UbiE